METVQLNFRIKKENYDSIKEYVKENGYTMNFIGNKIIEDFLIKEGILKKD